jgi:hypothetical protein
MLQAQAFENQQLTGGALPTFLGRSMPGCECLRKRVMLRLKPIEIKG